MTKLQIQTLHISRCKLERASAGQFARPEFDLLLINLGGVKADADGVISSKALTNIGFERVMAFLEEKLEKVDPHIGCKWRTVDDRRREGLLTRRQEWEIGQIYNALVAAGGPSYSLDGLAHRHSNHRVKHIGELHAGEASDVIEMLKAAVSRQPQTARRS